MPIETETQAVELLLDRLAAFEAGDLPVLSLYLDTTSHDNGRPTFDRTLRKQLSQVARTFRAASAERQSFDTDVLRMQSWLDTELRPSTCGAALFACQAAGLFEAVQLDVPFAESRLVVAPNPHLYPLAHVADQYRRYAAVVADTSTAHIWVFGLKRTLAHQDVVHEKTKRHKVGGWSQIDFQRNVDRQRQRHIQDVAAALTRIVRDNRIESVIVGGDEMFVSAFRAELPREVAERIVDIPSLDIRAPEHRVLAETLLAFRRQDAVTDQQLVEQLVDEVRGSGLGVAGMADVLAALTAGQVDRLVMPATAAAIIAQDGGPGDERLADDLVARARRTDARVTFVEDARLLEPLGGVGALLRYRLTAEHAVPPVQE